MERLSRSFLSSPVLLRRLMEMHARFVKKIIRSLMMLAISIIVMTANLFTVILHRQIHRRRNEMCTYGASKVL